MNTAIALPTISRKLPGNEALDSRLRVAADAHTRDYKGMKKTCPQDFFAEGSIERNRYLLENYLFIEDDDEKLYLIIYL